MVFSPVIKDDAILGLSEKYGIQINPNDAMQYKLCQIIVSLEYQLEEEKKKNQKPSKRLEEKNEE